MADTDGEEIEDEPVCCSDCGETPELRYDPTSGAPYSLQCDCEEMLFDVTDVVEQSELSEPITGKWSNFDYNSSMRYDEVKPTDN